MSSRCLHHVRGAMLATVMIIGFASAALQVTGCTSEKPSPEPVASQSDADRPVTTDWRAQTSDGLTFRYPPTWRYYPYAIGGTMESISGYLSTDALTQPCTTTTSATGTEDACGQPLTTLAHNGVLITFGGFDGPHRAQPAQTTNSTIAGEPAVTTAGPATSACAAIGGEYEIRVLAAGDRTGVQRPIELDACLAGPDTRPAQEAFEQLRATLAYGS